VNVGHNHPRIIERLRAHLGESALEFLHIGPSAAMGELAERLAGLAGPPLEVALFSCTGAEAVEAGMKLARLATKRPRFVSCAGGYHGLSFGTVAVSGVEKMRATFAPLLEGCARVPFGNLRELERELAKKDVAAFIVDPFNCETDAAPPPPGFLREAQELCKKYRTTLVLDEVQTGIGRTGSLFAYQAEGFVPDVLVLAKSLSGGVAPIGVTLTSRELHERCVGVGDLNIHGSTFAGNAFGCAAALETLAIVKDEGLAENAVARGAELRSGLEARLKGHPLVRSIRGRGLLVSIELGPTDSGWVNRLAPGLVSQVARTVFGQWAAVKLLERGIICQPASQNWNVLKLEPPLTIKAPEVELVVKTVGDVLSEYQGLAPLLEDVTKRLGKQFLAGWVF
jgi:putrescine aminotransferase